MNLFSMYKLMKDSLFQEYQPKYEAENVLKIPKLGKRDCVMCSQPVGACEINKKHYTKKQAYNKFKALSLDGKLRCQTCMVKWLEGIINECI